LRNIGKIFLEYAALFLYFNFFFAINESFNVLCVVFIEETSFEESFTVVSKLLKGKISILGRIGFLFCFAYLLRQEGAKTNKHEPATS
jgi:hypothetical protein